MGLCIYNEGCFKKGASLSGIVDEVRDIEIYGWKYNVFETGFPGGHWVKRTHDNKLSFAGREVYTIIIHLKYFERILAEALLRRSKRVSQTDP